MQFTCHDIENLDKINKKKRGKFRITRFLVETQPEIVQLLLSKMLIFEAIWDTHSDTILYSGWSNLFPIEVAEGILMPEYAIEVTRQDEDFDIYFREIK